MGILRRGDWATMYSGGYRAAVRLRDYPHSLDAEEAEAGESLADPWLADLGVGAWITGIRDARAGDLPRIELTPEDH